MAGNFPAMRYLAIALIAWATVSAQAHAEAAPTPEQIDQGREVYEDNCQTCHGRDMVSPGLVIFDLRKFPKDDPDALPRLGARRQGHRHAVVPRPHQRRGSEPALGLCAGWAITPGLKNCRRAEAAFFSHRENF